MGADTFMHQARYAIALHDAEVEVLVSKEPGGCRLKSLATPRAMASKTGRRERPGMRYSEAAECFQSWVIMAKSVEYY